MRNILNILSLMITISLSFYSPALGQDKVIGITEYLDEEFAQLIINYKSTMTNYSNGNFVNIREYPNTESTVLGHLLYNTNVEVIATYNGWSCIITENGIAFVASQYLSEYKMPRKEYTQEELYIMAHVLSGECQGYSDIEQLYVGSVVLNRISSEKYPNTIKEVVFQPRQYGCIYDGNYYREPTDRNWENARWLLENGSILPEYVVYQARRKQGDGVYLKTGYHYYCY